MLKMFRTTWYNLSAHNRVFCELFLRRHFGDHIERYYGTHNIHRNYGLYKTYWSQKPQRNIRSLQTTTYKSALPTWMLITYGQVPTVLTMIIGRYLKWKWSDFPLGTTSRIKELVFAKRNVFLTLFLLALSSSMWIYFSGLQKEPLTNRRKFIGLSKKEIDELAASQYKDESPILEMLTVSPTDSRYLRVAKVLKRLLDANDDIQSVREKNWNIFVINAPYYVNALAFHNGTVFVFSGTLQMCSKDDQLAFVLAHEIAHVLLLHMPELHSKIHLMDFVLLLPLILIWALLSLKSAILLHCLTIYLTDLFIHYPFIRGLEYEADEIGLRLIAKACYDVREASVFWHKVQSLLMVDDGKPVEWFSTHPGTRSRRQHLDTVMKKAVDLRNKYECPELPTKDPRLIISDSYIPYENRKKG